MGPVVALKVCKGHTLPSSSTSSSSRAGAASIIFGIFCPFCVRREHFGKRGERRRRKSAFYEEDVILVIPTLADLSNIRR